MISAVAFLLLFNSPASRADSSKLFRVSRNGGSSSYLLGTHSRAWFSSVGDVPVEIRRAIQKSNVLVFAGMSLPDVIGAAHSERSRAQMKRSFSTIDRLGLEARQAYFQILSVSNAFAGEHLHPALILMMCLRAHTDRRRDEVEDFDRFTTVEPDAENLAIIRDLLGPDAAENCLVMGASAARARFAEGAVPFHLALRQLALRARLRLANIPETGSTETNLDVMIETVTEWELELGLLHLQRESRGDLESRVQRRLLLDTLNVILEASYLAAPRSAVTTLRRQEIGHRLSGLESYRLAMDDRRTLWISNLTRELGKGGTFVATELQNIFGSGNALAPGLKEMLEDAGLDVTPVEIDCSSSLLSTNVAPYQGTTRSTPWRLKLPSASSNPTASKRTSSAR